MLDARENRFYRVKVPGAPGHLCSRCAMTKERRALYAGNCPFSTTPVADLCPYSEAPKQQDPATASEGGTPC